MKTTKNQIRILFFSLCLLLAGIHVVQAQQSPNVIFICVDDLGYGDLSCYGATKIQTPQIDKLASNGLRFTDGHSTSATCTPSRYALMTGEYPWRKGASILPGDAALIIPEKKMTLPRLFQKAGYNTGIVGKWHLGLGKEVHKDWNGIITPGPNEVGFNYSFIFPATADRVPTVFMENHHVVGLNPADPIEVNYQTKVGNDPTGKEHPELLKMRSSPNHGHDNTIVNGIGRIGFMSGGKTARWTDEEMPLTFLEKAKTFVEENKDKPFFLYYAPTEPHVPRMPSTLFKGKSIVGFRGDAILQLDWSIGELMKTLDCLGLTKNTLIIFTSDNGPVLDDGYMDDAVEKQNGHLPAGPFRGGKYSAFEAGTRVPLILHWPAAITPAVSDALVCQVDFVRSFSTLLHQPLEQAEATDSEDTWKAFAGKSKTGREMLVQQGGALSIRKGKWKYIEPNHGAAIASLVNIELGNSPLPQLYDLSADKEEKNNLANQYPQVVKELAALLEKTKSDGRFEQQ